MNLVLVVILGALISFNPINAEASETGEAFEPRAEVEFTNKDLGPVPFDETFSHSFDIKNTGSGPLHIRVGKKSCSCTTSLVSAEVVPSGGTIAFELGYVPKFNSNRVSSRSVSATIETNDPSRPEILFRVSAKQVWPIEADVAYLDYGKLTIGTAGVRELSVTLRPYRGQSLALEEVATSSPGIRVKELSRKEVNGAQVLRYEVRLEHAQPLSEKLPWLRLETNSTSLPSLEIPIRLKTVFDIISTQVNNTATLGVVRPGEIRAKVIELVSELNMDLSAFRIAPSSPFLHAEHLPRQKEEPFMLRLTVAGTDTPGRFSEYVDFIGADGKIVGRVLVRALIRK